MTRAQRPLSCSMLNSTQVAQNGADARGVSTAARDAYSPYIEHAAEGRHTSVSGPFFNRRLAWARPPMRIQPMRIQRTLAPTAAPLTAGDLVHALAGTFHGESYSRSLVAELRHYFGAKHVFLISSGKAALTLILLALRRLSDKREVLLPAYTCHSVPAAVERAGLSPTLADVDPDTLDFDYGSLGKSIGPRTLCVVSTHLFGIPADIDRVRALCRHDGTLLVEDAAQAMGGRYHGQLLGSLGDVGFFSLGRGKNITAGSGGIVLTNSERIGAALTAEYDRLATPGIAKALVELTRIVLLSIFIRPSLYWLPAGLPFLGLGETHFERDFPVQRMSGASSGALRHWRDRLSQANRTRTAAAADFAARMELEGVASSHIPYLRLPVLMRSRDARDRACALSASRGLGIGRMYPAPINEIDEIKDHFTGQTFPSAKLVADRLLTLPTHHLVTESDRQAVCDLLQDREECERKREAATTQDIEAATGEQWT